MHIRLLNPLIFVASFLAWSPFVWAGPGSTGGGKGVVCRNADNSIKSVELLDLWEAREMHQETIVPVTGDLAGQVDLVLQSLSNAYPLTFLGAKTSDTLLPQMRKSAALFLIDNPGVLRKHGVTLEDTDDAVELMKPADCKIEQIVNYQPLGAPILVNQDLYEKMDLTNQTALIAHEAFYELLRLWADETNSLRVRRAIGYAFSSQKFDFPGIPSWVGKAKTIECSAPPTAPGDDGMLHFLGTDIQISSDLKQVYFNTIVGTPLMGGASLQSGTGVVFGAPEPLPNDELKTLFDNRAFAANCKTSNSYVAVWQSLGGPIEYDRAIYLTRNCGKPPTEITASTRAPGEQRFVSFPLTCKVRK